MTMVENDLLDEMNLFLQDKVYALLMTLADNLEQINVNIKNKNALNNLNNFKLSTVYNVNISDELTSTYILPILTHIIKIINTISKLDNKHFTLVDILSKTMFANNFIKIILI